MANSQHRCVFVGNIPYDATEEQLVQICEEVGPVVSFRLVIDRETGKPKGYGFCEYKDEETALSARRNLHGYDINGRQLRVDFAENDKNADKSREQGRGGPGLATNEAVGLQVAMAAAIVMAGALGANNNIQTQPTLGTDPLTLHLAKLPKGQLNEVLSELKAMATQNKEQVRQLFLAHPHLSKALLQAHIMLKSVPPHMIPLQGGQPQPLPGLPPLAHNKMQLGFLPHPTSMVPSQYSFQSPPVLQHPTLSAPSLLPQQPVGLSSAMLQPSIPFPTHPSLQDKIFKPSSSIGSANGNKDASKPQHLSHNPAWGRKIDHHPNMTSRLHESTSFVNDRDQAVHPPKLLKMEDGRGASIDMNHSTSLSGSSQAVPLSLESLKPNPELPPGVESALLQQVLNLRAEQLSSLPAEQQQQVIQLQQILRQSK